MTRWCSLETSRPLARPASRHLLQLAARGALRLSDVARLSRQPASGTIRRAPRARRSVAAGG